MLVNDPDFRQRAEIIREKGTNRSQFFRGQVDKYTWVEPGSSYLPSEIIGAFLYAQLEHAEEIIAARKNLCWRYAEALLPLQEAGHVELPNVEAGNGHMFYLLLASVEARTRLIEHLKARDILSVFHYVPLHSSPAGQRLGRVSGSMAVTDSTSDRLLRLPLYYEMDEESLARVVNGVNSFFAQRV